MSPRKIIYVTGTRADYGLMREVLKKLHYSEDIELSLCVTGMHLESLYGNTVNEIKEDLFRICAELPVGLTQGALASMATSIGHEIIGMTELFERERPDIILLLGDRGEMLAGAIAAVHLNIHVVHVHGGERSGTVDEMIRHAISKLSHYHFVATIDSKARLIRMGEQEESIFVVGAPGLDEIKQHRPSTKTDFLNKFNFSANKKIALFIFHPVIQSYNDIQNQFKEAFNAALAQNLQIICLEPNSDAGGQFIRAALLEYANHPDVRILTHLHRHEFIECLAQVNIMIGNSSSAIIEAVSFNLVAVNIGSRQNLRERNANVIDVASTYDAIFKGLEEALAREPRDYDNCYGDGTSSEHCLRLLQNISLENHLLNKCNAY